MPLIRPRVRPRRTRRGARPPARRPAGRSARRRRPDCSRTNSAKSAAKSASSGTQGRRRQEVPLGQPDEDAAVRAELRREMGDDLGQQDPGGIPAVAGVRADQPAIAGDLVGPRRASRTSATGSPCAASWISDGPDAPRQQVVAVDDDVVARRHRSCRRPAVRPARRRAAAGRGSCAPCATRWSRSSELDRRGPASRPGGRPGRSRSWACAQSCSGESTADVVGFGRRRVAADRARNRRSGRGSRAPCRDSAAAARRRGRARCRARHRCRPGVSRSIASPPRVPALSVRSRPARACR